MIKRYIESYGFDGVSFKSDGRFDLSEKGFIIKLRLSEYPKEESVILDIPECLTVTQRLLSPQDEEKLDFYEKSECYFQKTDLNGCAPILETEITLNDAMGEKTRKMKLGVNILMYDITKKDLYVVYDTVNFRLVYDGTVINNNLPVGRFECGNSDMIKFDMTNVTNIEYSNKISDAKYYRTYETIDKKLNYYTPHGHNAFIGDIANFYHNGVYHMLYMPDRHHHSNRWGGGGHHFEHMITRDFVNWEDVGPIWDITEQWQSTGTGTMFFYKGKYYVSFGLHTSRVIPEEKIANAAFDSYYKKTGKAKLFTFDELEKMGLYPSGASYAVSDDGINFVQSKKIYNSCENPSIYSKDNELLMYGGYNGSCSVWTADDIDGPWQLKNSVSFECFDSSPMRNSAECPSFFEWNGYKYLIMGVTGFWRTEKNSDVYVEYASKGFDVYEGLAVPMAVKTDDDRVVIAGWIGGMAWGSMVVHRELIQYENGNLGMKWLPELFPEIKNTKKAHCGSIKIEKEKMSHYFEAEFEPEDNAAFGVRLIDVNGKVCELKLDLAAKKAQYGTCKEGETAEDILPMHEAVKTVENKGCGFDLKPENLPHRCGDFAIANVRYPKGKIKVRILMYYFEKNDGTVIDTEIAGTRTMITNRGGFFPSKAECFGAKAEAQLSEAQL